MVDEGFQFRLLDPTRLEALVEMFRLCFGRDVDVGYFRWKYLQSPGGEVAAFTAQSGERIAAFYGLLPERYSINGKVKTVYQSMDTMTHPDFQRRGLFVETARRTYDHVRTVGGELNLIGVTGENAYHGFVNKLDWRHIEKLKYVFVRRALFNATSVLRSHSRLDFRTIDELDPQRFDVYLACREPSPLPISHVLSGAYLKWRAFDHPLETYDVTEIAQRGQLVGIVVGQLNDRGRYRLKLVDFSSRSMFRTHLPATVAWLFNRPDIETIYTWRPQDRAYRMALRRCGFIYNPFPRGPLSYRQPLITLSDQPTADGIDWYDPGQFDLQPLHQV